MEQIYRVWWKNIPAFIVQTITGKKRYIPYFEWSKKSWTHNVFRFYELVFGRAEGIRKESMATTYVENGCRYVRYELYTIESCFALFESFVRDFLKKDFHFFHIEKLAFASVDAPQLCVPWISFAIALDAAANGTTTATSPITFSKTCTGSNLILMIGVGTTATSPTISTPTYNSVSASLDGSQQTNVANMAAMYSLVAPATGSNTVSCAFGGTAPDCNVVAASYSGAKQTGQPDASGGGTGASAPNPNWNTVATNCWASCVLSAISVSGGNQTSRGGVITLSGTHQMEFQDTNGPLGIGNITFAWGAGTTTWAGAGASFAPIPAAQLFTQNLNINQAVNRASTY